MIRPRSFSGAWSHDARGQFPLAPCLQCRALYAGATILDAGEVETMDEPELAEIRRGVRSLGWNCEPEDGGDLMLCRREDEENERWMSHDIGE